MLTVGMLQLYAYIDPVSGMLLLQAIIAGIVGVVASFRRTIWGFFARLFGRKATSAKE